MKNVKLDKAGIGKGWFLTIGDDNVKNRWAVTSEELWETHKVIEDNLMKIMEEMERGDTKTKDQVVGVDMECTSQTLERVEKSIEFYLDYHNITEPSKTMIKGNLLELLKRISCHISSF